MTSPVATKAASWSAYLDGSGSFFYFSIGHLGSDRTFPYQVVQTAFLRRALYFRLVHIGGAVASWASCAPFVLVWNWRLLT